MSFDETQHPRGQATNAGQFRDKTNDAPVGELTETDESAGYDQWRILADRLPDLVASVEKVNRRLERAGVAERFAFTAEQKVWRDEHGRPWMVADVTLSRPSITVGEWRFVAQHEKTAAGAVISHYAGDTERVDADPSMRCDHCGQFRGRQKVYTVRNPDTGEVKQIGSSCLALFLGVRPEGLWAMAAEVGAETRFDEGGTSSRASTPNAYDGDQLLLATLRQVAEDGEFIPRSRASVFVKPTIDKLTDHFTALTIAPPTTEEAAEVTAITEWLESLEPASDEDYLLNLKAAFTRAPGDDFVAVSTKHAALAASAVSAYRRHIQRQAEQAVKAEVQAKKKPEFVFQPGETLKGKNLELRVISMRDGQDYGYGAPTHITLMDDDGHVFYWKSSGHLISSVELSDGATYTFMPTEGARIKVTGGTVKEHRVSEYNGDHETVIWRVKTAPMQEQIDVWEAEHAIDVAEREAAQAERDARRAADLAG